MFAEFFTLKTLNETIYSSERTRDLNLNYALNLFELGDVQVTLLNRFPASHTGFGGKTNSYGKVASK